MFMVKTTINLDEEIYTEIVKESIEKYGSTKNISKIINQRLRNKKADARKSGKRIVFKVIRNRIIKSLRKLENEPESGKPLTSILTGLWSMRIGDYWGNLSNKEQRAYSFSYQDWT